MPDGHVVIVGAGSGGLAAALTLAAKGVGVTVLERAAKPGGKMREVDVGTARIDGGPTVFTMRWVFEELFDEAGLSFSDSVPLTPAQTLARHAWSDTERLDLFADIHESADAIGAFSGADEARRFLTFADNARSIYQKLEGPFLRSPKPTLFSIITHLGLGGLQIRPFTTLWRALQNHFTDPRLIQLFGRYSTYCGSSPFLAPATLMLIAHVELDGVWLVDGGMYRLTEALEKAATGLGAEFRTNSPVAEILIEGGKASGVKLENGEAISADAVIVNADATAIGAGRFGVAAARAVEPIQPHERSFSALAWTLHAETSGFDLLRHTVFFNREYAREFDDIIERQSLPGDPTVYICAQDRPASGPLAMNGPERMLMVINAPPTGDNPTFDQAEIERCQERSIRRLSDCGLTVRVNPQASIMTTPIEFDRLFPATGGALYGRANHRADASFRRPDARTTIEGLYLAGGSVHPGPGVPMAAMSGRLAAKALLSDFASTRRSRPAATAGGMSMR